MPTRGRRRKSRGRSGKKRLDDAIDRERAILDKMGFPTWSAYVMGSSLMGIDPAAERLIVEMRDRLADGSTANSTVLEGAVVQRLADNRLELSAASSIALGTAGSLDLPERHRQDPAANDLAAIGRRVHGQGKNRAPIGLTEEAPEA